MKKLLTRTYLLKGEHGTEYIVSHDVEDRIVRYFKVEELSFEEHGTLMDELLKEASN